VTTYLDRIVARHREVASLDRRSLAELRAEALDQPPARGFRGALAAADGLGVIAEIKRRSPSKGVLRDGLDPAAMASAYASGGATCLSVLTDVEFFGGSADDLRIARQSCSLPVLRKDFTVCAADVYDARAIGADCVLLIAAALTGGELEEFHGLAVDIGLDALVEVHDEAELDAATAAGASLVGVNQRNLVTFAVDHERAVRMGSRMSAGVVRVAESGVRGPDDARSLAAAGYHAVLVGESLVTAADPAAAVAALRVAA
jgi:indole-3-glycerol phosphate synthase